MAADMATELKKNNVACISLWPGAVETEVVQTSSNGENVRIQCLMFSDDKSMLSLNSFVKCWHDMEKQNQHTIPV